MGKPKYFSQFPRDCIELKSRIGANQGNMIFSISLKNIVDHFISVEPGKINIKIRRGSSIWIQKSFEIKIQFNGIYIGDPETVSHN